MDRRLPMTIHIRRDQEIHREEGGWFTARWHFSFDRYYDPEYMGFGNMRVFNDDRLIPGAIWPMHPHRDIEGLTYVVEGLFRHQDDVGGPPGPLPAGSVQRMTLGSGAWHSEQNGSETEPMRFIQIWILPSERGLPPGVEQRVFTKEGRTGRLLRAISPEGGDAVKVHGDASVFVSALAPGDAVGHQVADGRGAYLYVISGALEANGERMATGDAARIRSEPDLKLAAAEDTELILVDVALS
ncbi:MAG: pirin family protein [Actinomycetota bacterium]|nr:pirin family protein [Actinomycetota bacterium]